MNRVFTVSELKKVIKYILKFNYELKEHCDKNEKSDFDRGMKVMADAILNELKELGLVVQ